MKKLLSISFIAVTVVIISSCDQNSQNQGNEKEGKLRDSIINADKELAEEQLASINEINSVILNYYYNKNFFDNGLNTIKTYDLDYAKMYLGILPSPSEIHEFYKTEGNECIITYFDKDYALSHYYIYDKASVRAVSDKLLKYNLKLFRKEYYRTLLKDPLYIKNIEFSEDKFNIWYTTLSSEYNELLADNRWQEYLRKKEVENRKKQN